MFKRNSQRKKKNRENPPFLHHGNSIHRRLPDSALINSRFRKNQCANFFELVKFDSSQLHTFFTTFLHSTPREKFLNDAANDACLTVKKKKRNPSGSSSIRVFSKSNVFRSEKWRGKRSEKRISKEDFPR